MRNFASPDMEAMERAGELLHVVTGLTAAEGLDPDPSKWDDPDRLMAERARECEIQLPTDDGATLTLWAFGPDATATDKFLLADEVTDMTDEDRELYGDHEVLAGGYIEVDRSDEVGYDAYNLYRVAGTALGIVCARRYDIYTRSKPRGTIGRLWDGIRSEVLISQAQSAEAAGKPDEAHHLRIAAKALVEGKVYGPNQPRVLGEPALRALIEKVDFMSLHGTRVVDDEPIDAEMIDGEPGPATE